MFGTLSTRLENIFDNLKKRGSLTSQDIVEALRDVRRALLEADVALPVVKSFIKKVQEVANGQEIVKGINPAQQVIKIVHDQLIETLGAENSALNLNSTPPVSILMVGLQGSGKTTSAAKLAQYIQTTLKKKVLLCSLDVYRPAAQEQLSILGQQIDIESVPIIQNQMPEQITSRAMNIARLRGFDVLILDTAGRLGIDEQLMAEVQRISEISNPVETMMVLDSLTGQDAVNTAQSFSDRCDLTGIILTKIDGDARGGAALSMRAVTGKPIKFLGTGEKVDAFDVFHPDRIAQRILGMGDIVSLVEKAEATMEEEESKRLARKFSKGKFDLNDMYQQINNLKKIGGLGKIVSMLPQVGKIKKALSQSNLDEKILTRNQAIINSMTPKERQTPKVIAASRKKRIAAGSGTSVQDVNKLLKQFLQMSTMMKKVGKTGKLDSKGLLPDGLDGMF